MSDLSTLLDSEPRVVTAGIDVLAEALEAQSVDVQRVDWSPPVPGTGDALAVLARSQATVEANRVAMERLLAVRPQLVGVGTARDLLPGVDDRTFLHAGPPLTWGDASGPMPRRRQAHSWPEGPSLSPHAMTIDPPARWPGWSARRCRS